MKFVRREKRQPLLHHPNTAALLSTSATTNGSLPHKDEKGNDQPASMMEQLVPEIMQHTLSYLDYRSLCNMSMTCSVLRRVANDDSVWKAVFHKVSSQSRAMGRHKLALLCLNFSSLLMVPVSDCKYPSLQAESEGEVSESITITTKHQMSLYCSCLNRYTVTSCVSIWLHRSTMLMDIPILLIWIKMNYIALKKFFGPSLILFCFVMSTKKCCGRFYIRHDIQGMTIPSLYLLGMST